MKNLTMPKLVDVSITNYCNLRCSYCLHFSSPGDVDTDLPKEEWFKFFKEIHENSIDRVILSGGEPLIRKDIQEIISKLAEYGIQFTILTNGTLITDEMASFLKETGKCRMVQVSIDGAVPITHDSFRGTGNFKKAMDGIANLQKYGVPVTVRVTVHKKNVRELDEIAGLLLEEIKLPGFSTCNATYLGLCRKNAEELMLSTDEKTYAMEKLLELSQKYDNKITANAGSLADARIWTKMKQDAENKAEPPKSGGCLSACDGVSDKISVRPDGIMTPCVLLPHIELGKINEVSLKDAWFNHPEMARLRDRWQIPLSTFDKCRECAFVNYCSGSCPAISYNTLGDENTPAPDICLKAFLEDGGRLPEETIAKIKRKKAVPEWLRMLNSVLQD